MPRECLVLLLLILILPATVSCVVAYTPIYEQTDIARPIRIDPMLVKSIEESHIEQQAVLQFQRELTDAEIRRVEETGIRLVRRGTEVIHVGRIYVAYVSSLDDLQALTEIGLVQATDGSRKFTPSLTTSVPITNAPTVWSSLRRGGENISGRGARVAIIDTGIQWLHPSFWRVVGEPLNVILKDDRYYADLDNDSVADTDEGPIRLVDIEDPGRINVAKEYLFIDTDYDGQFEYECGDRWLAGVDSNNDGILTLPSEKVVLLGESKVVALYDQTTRLVYLRDTNLTTLALNVRDDNGHGTHVASIVAAGQIGHTSMLGMAPDADLIIVKSTLQSSDIISGIHFAVEQGADVINMSFSSFSGFLDGTDVEDLAVSETFLRYGVLSTIAAGNLGGSSKHAYLQVDAAASESAALSVNSPPLYSFVNILWHSEDSDEHIVLTSPNSEVIDLGSFPASDQSFEVDAEDLKAYVFMSTSIRGMKQVLIQTGTTSHRWESGSWSVTVTNPAGNAIGVNMYAWDNSWSGHSLRFESHVENLRTLSSPATSDTGVAVASYDENTNNISISSGRGPRIDGVAKPEVAAPGNNILAASRYLTTLWETRSGTSMAAPHVAGLVALLSQAMGHRPGWTGLSVLLHGAGGSEAHFTPPDPMWGYGLCDALASVRMLIQPPIGATSQDWAGIITSLVDPIDPLVEPRLDIRGVRRHQTTRNITLAIKFQANVSFDDSNEFRLDWDTDSDAQTGEAGIELRVILSNGSLNVSEWSGSEFVPKSLDSGFWYAEDTLFLWLDLPDVKARGNMTFGTYNMTHTRVDWTDWLLLDNQWPASIQLVNVTVRGNTYDVSVRLYDIDTPPTDLALKWQLVDGTMQAVERDVEYGETDIQFSLESVLLHPNYTYGRSSLILNVTDGDRWLSSCPILLPLTYGIEFIEARLDTETVITGPFITSIVTGRIQISGMEYVDSLMLGLQSSDGEWLNLTLSGSGGVYEIRFSVAGMHADRYRVFAIVLTVTEQLIENEFASLSVIEVNIIPIVLGLVTIGAVVLLMVHQRKRRT